MLDKKLNKLKKFVPKNSKVGKALALKDKLTGEDKKGEEEQEKKKGSGGTPSTMSIAKVVFGSGIAIGGAVIIGCIVMTAVTMFSTVTGTSVQIIDGSIIQYGEPTPGPEKDKKKGVGSGEYSGDELYIKLKMIVEAVEADNSLKKKVDKVKVPDSVPHDLRSGSNGIGMNTKRGGIYHLLQVGYIMKEISMNEWTSKLEDTKGNKLSYDWRGLLGMFYQENSCGSSYENDFPSDSDGGWLSAFKLSTLGSDGTPGAFQTQKAYFGDGQRSFITSIENSSAGTYGKVGKPKDVKDLMKKCVNSRIKAGSSQDSVNDTSCYFFADSVASSINGVIWDNAYCPNEHFKQTVGNKDYPKESDNILAMLYLAWGHRGGAFYQSNHRWDSGDLVHMLAEAAVDGLLVEDELMKYLDKIPTGIGYEEFAREITKSGGLIDAIMKDDKLGLHQDYKALTMKIGTGYVDGGRGNQVPKDMYKDPFFRLCVCLHGGQEIEALANAAFDELGLTLPTSGGGKMELKETPGEFQGFWSDKNGKTLSSDEMKAYCNKYSYLSNQIKYVGTKEDSTNFTGKYAVDSFKDKFGDNIGFIHYHQCGGTTYRANKLYCDSSGKTWGSYGYFCGGYSCAMAMSSLYHRYIHPVEIVCAKATYHDRTGKTMTNYTDGGTTSAFKYGGHHALFSEQVYKGKKMFKVDDSTALNKTKVDETLAAGGLVIGSFKPPIASGTHYVVIREKKGDKYYLGDSSANDAIRAAKNHNHEFTWSDLNGCKNGSGNCTYIAPGPGYKEYLNDYMTSQSEASGGSSGGSGRYLGEEIVEYAKTFVGKLPYNHGLSLTSGTDCSGFVKLIYQHFGKDKNMPRTSYDQYDYWISKGVKKVQFKKNKLKPGDLLYYIRGSKIGHVAMYAGNGKVVHESNETDGCKISDWNYNKPKGVFRILSDSDVSSSGGGNGNYQYWTQGDYGTGTSGKCKCPQPISGGCFVYSLMKIARASGANFDVKSAWNTIRAKNYAESDGYVNSPEGIMKVCGVNVEYKKQETGKFDFSTSTGKKKLSKLAKKYMKQGYYVIARIGTSSTDRHFLNICSSDGKTFDVWDSGSAKTTKGGANNFINVYKNFNGRKETWLYNFRLIKVK